MARYAAWDNDRAGSIIAGLAHLEGAMLPILHALQEMFGHVDPQAVAPIAEALNLSRAEVHGTISFYHEFRTTPPPERIVRLCRAEACQALGCETLVALLAREHGIVVDGPPNGDAAIETVYCLGNCALGPAAMVDGRLHGRVDAARLIALLAGSPASREAAP